MKIKLPNIIHKNIKRVGVTLAVTQNAGQTKQQGKHKRAT